MLDDLRETLDRYCGFEVSGLYCLFPHTGEQSDISDLRWPAEYPHSKRRGVYLILGGTGRLLYVGKASQQPIGTRLGNYFQYSENNGCRVMHSGWSESPAFVVTIAVRDDEWYKATSLEEYLIAVLRPCDNNIGLKTAAGAA